MPVVAIVNTHEDTVNLLRHVFELDGFQTVNAFVHEIRRGDVDFVRFMSQHGPDVVVYDIAPPLAESWNFMKLIKNTEVLRGVPFVITTTNRPALQKLVGDDVEIHEMLTKPYDIDEILGAVRRAYQSRSAS
jgi:DNA-binding response OmpR family regulator